MTVNFKTGPSPEVLLTAADVATWKEELVAAEAMVALLKRKLEAASVFFPAQAAAPAPATASSDGATVGDWVLKVLKDQGKALEPREIRIAIDMLGGPLGSENYLYTAIKRLAERNLIVKRGNAYAAPSESSLEGEAGGQR
jgi:hypothetical protein